MPLSRGETSLLYLLFAIIYSFLSLSVHVESSSHSSGNVPGQQVCPNDLSQGYLLERTLLLGEYLYWM